MKLQRGLPVFLARYPLAALIGAAALLLGGLGYVQQGYELWLGGIKPWQLQAGFAALFVTSVLMVLYRSYRDHGAPPPDEAAATAQTPTEVHNVTSHNQSGGITAHTVNQAPEPEFKCGRLTREQNPDGTFTMTCQFAVVAPYPPDSLRLKAISPGIKSLEVTPQGRMGVFQSGHTGKRDGFCFTSLQHPAGTYRLRVVSASNQLWIEHSFT